MVQFGTHQIPLGVHCAATATPQWRYWPRSKCTGAQVACNRCCRPSGSVPEADGAGEEG